MTFGQRLYTCMMTLSQQLGRKVTQPEFVALADQEFGRATKERKKAAVLPEAEQIYELYPKKVGREDALRAISKALRGNTFDYLCDKTNQFREAVESWPTSYRYFQDGGDRCPHPASWFNAGRYADAPSEWKRRGAHNPATHQKISPPEPQNWREAFPDFVDRDKPWHMLQPAQQAYIIANIATAQHFSEPVEAEEQRQILRQA